MRWSLGFLLSCLLGSTALADPILYLSKDDYEAVWLGADLRYPAVDTFDAADRLSVVKLKPGQILWAEDRDHDVFKTTVLSAVLDADGRFMVKVEVENRQSGFDLFLHLQKPTAKGGGKGFHVDDLVSAKDAVRQKLAAWLSHYLNHEVFRIQDYGTGYEFEQFHLPLPGGKQWLICYTYTEDSGKTVAKINLAQVNEAALPKPEAVKILATLDGFFLDHWEWMDVNHNRKPDIRVNAMDGEGWKMMEINGQALTLLFGPAKVVREETIVPAAPTAPATPAAPTKPVAP